MTKGNSLYTGFIWQSGGGGVVCILDNDKPQKVPMDFPMIKGHSGTILDIDWYPFDDHYLASSSMDNSIKIWQVPEEFKEDMTES
jgi:WD40 repeat protein